MISPFPATSSGQAVALPSLHRPRAGLEFDKSRRVFLLLHLIGDVVAELLSDLLLGLGIEVG
jgi:hypothetical protein